MTPQTKKELSAFGSDKKRLAALHKTAEEMAEPSGTSVQLLVGQAIDAYWAVRENAEEVREGEETAQFSFVEETIALARAAAWRMVSPLRSFVNDLCSTLAPATITLVLLCVVALVLASSGKSLPTKWVPVFTTVAPLVLGGVTVTLLVYRKVPALTHSIGAIAGGAILAATLLGYSTAQWTSKKIVSQELSFSTSALAQDKLEELALHSMELRHEKGGFLQTSPNLKGVESSSELLKFYTKSNIEEQAVYEVAAKGLDGHMFAEVTSRDGSLYYVAEDSERQLRSAFLFGKVSDVNDTSFTLKNDESTEPKKFSRGLWLQKPSVGDYVIVAIDPKTSTANKLITIDSRYAHVE